MQNVVILFTDLVTLHNEVMEDRLPMPNAPKDRRHLRCTGTNVAGNPRHDVMPSPKYGPRISEQDDSYRGKHADVHTEVRTNDAPPGQLSPWGCVPNPVRFRGSEA